MTTAIDLGSSEFRSIRRERQRLIARRTPAIYTVLDASAAQRRILDQSRIPYSVAAESLVVIGRAAAEIAAALSRPLIPILYGGRLASGDPVGRQVCAGLVESLLLPARTKGETCLLVLPEGVASESEEDDATSRFLQRLVELRGYKTRILHAATALAMAELSEVDFTGLGLTIGAESISFSLIQQARPVFEGRVLKGTRRVIERFAQAQKMFLWDQTGNAYLDLQKVRRRICRDDANLFSPRASEDLWLAHSLEELLRSAITSLKSRLSERDLPVTGQPLPLIVSGGICRAPGFLQLLAKALSDNAFPFPISEIRHATFEPYAVARGLMIQSAFDNAERSPQFSFEAA